MRHTPFTLAGAALLLAGCTGQSAGFMHLQALAEAGDARSQVELAQAYADPARFPDRGPTRADLTQATKWCYIALATGTAVAEPVCTDLLAAAPPPDRTEGQWMARNWLEGPERWLNR
jgi:hypothetical protein